MTDHPDIVEYAGWLADKLHNTNDYGKEAAALLVKHAVEITRLRAEAEALRKDAERYRWLRDPSNGKALQIMREYGLEDAKDLDDAIDAAIAATKEQQ